MKKKIIKAMFVMSFLASPLVMTSCYNYDKEEQRAELELLKKRVEEVEGKVADFNQQLEAFSKVLNGKAIVGVDTIANGFKIHLSDTTTLSVSDFGKVGTIMPNLAVNANGEWVYSIDKGVSWKVLTTADGKPMSAIVKVGTLDRLIMPKVKIDDDGFWQLSTDGGTTWMFIDDAQGGKLKAEEGQTTGSLFKACVYDEANNILELSLNNGQKYTFNPITGFYLKIDGAESASIVLGKELRLPIKQGDIEDISILSYPQGWHVKIDDKELLIESTNQALQANQAVIKFLITSPKGYLRIVSLNINIITSEINPNWTEAYKKFVRGDKDNVLIDFSYAGYEHGEKSVPDINTLGYKVYDITKYGAVANDDKSDREALLRVIKEITGFKGDLKDVAEKANAGEVNAVIYFPEGRFILHDDADNEGGVADIQNGAGNTFIVPKNVKSTPILIRMSNIVFKGAGKEKTFLEMRAPMLPKTSNQMWSSPVMLQFKNNSDANLYKDSKQGVLGGLTTITKDAEKGSFSVTVGSAIGISAGQWVVLHSLNNKQDVVDKELYPYKHTDFYKWQEMTINKNGVLINDRHQVASIKGNVITFKEPLMHEVTAADGWAIYDFPHYKNVGVEDLTFVGQAVDKFEHHRINVNPVNGAKGWHDDGAYKPLSMQRLVNSWVRNVNFESVSEAASIVGCANVSVYNIEIKGRRGHSSVRSAGSSRIFLGGIYDHSDGYQIIGNKPNGNMIQGAGQYHGPGVSKESIGAVIYKVNWGKDACFEAHASQPRATLIDASTGAFIPSRQGGADTEMPNHLNDLTIWNFNTKSLTLDTSWGGHWNWWNMNNSDRLYHNWRFVMPIVVGFSDASASFNDAQVKLNESCGKAVEPYSLYEAQLKNRLGFVPAWLSTVISR